jgi:hypothetical protein
MNDIGNLDHTTLIIIIATCASLIYIMSSYVPPHILLTIMFLMVLGYIAYLKVKKSKESIKSASRSIDTLYRESTGLETNRLLKTNSILSNAIIRFSKYASIDRGAFSEVIKDLNMFYELYGKLLLIDDKIVKPKIYISTNFDKMVVLRKKIIFILNSFIQKKHWLTTDKMYHGIIQVITNSTRTPISVLKKKNPWLRDKYMYPMPHNEFDDIYMV